MYEQCTTYQTGQHKTVQHNNIQQNRDYSTTVQYPGCGLSSRFGGIAAARLGTASAYSTVQSPTRCAIECASSAIQCSTNSTTPCGNSEHNLGAQHSTRTAQTQRNAIRFSTILCARCLDTVQCSRQFGTGGPTDRRCKGGRVDGVTTADPYWAAAPRTRVCEVKLGSRWQRCEIQREQNGRGEVPHSRGRDRGRHQIQHMRAGTVAG